VTGFDVDLAPGRVNAQEVAVADGAEGAPGAELLPPPHGLVAECLADLIEAEEGPGQRGCPD
jgi:hypothetical protein